MKIKIQGYILATYITMVPALKIEDMKIGKKAEEGS